MTSDIQVIAEHSIDFSILPEKANILDLGCLGFEFTDEMRKRGYNVYPVDIEHFEFREYWRYAIAGKDGFVGLIRTMGDRQATKIGPGNDIEAMTLKSFTNKTIGCMWDVIKMDVEGAEYEIIMGLEKAPARQLSIEFHLHTGAYSIFQMNEMENKLHDLGYWQMSHEYQNRYGAGLNYWDSLFILK